MTSDPLKNYTSIYRWPISPQCLEKVKQVAKDLKTHEDFLMAIMFVESSWNPQAIHPQSKAVGLIQILPNIAPLLGTTTQALHKMNFIEQMDYVKKYFEYTMGVFGVTSLPTMEQVSMAVLNPANMDKPPDYVLFSAPSEAYEQNKGLDLNKDGKITIADRNAFVREAVKPYRIRLLQDVEGFLKDVTKRVANNP